MDYLQAIKDLKNSDLNTILKDDTMKEGFKLALAILEENYNDHVMSLREPSIYSDCYER